MPRTYEEGNCRDGEMHQEKVNAKLVAKSIALIGVFAPCYTLFTFWPLFPVIGGSGSFITMAVVTAPLIGIVLGPFLSTVSVAIGGILGLFFLPFNWKRRIMSWNDHICRLDNRFHRFKSLNTIYMHNWRYPIFIITF